MKPKPLTLAQRCEEALWLSSWATDYRVFVDRQRILNWHEKGVPTRAAVLFGALRRLEEQYGAE